ncbi:bifunctional biotin--[acetyl-CoA-carboxylase] ligase/biotin operon repressor BirA [uncultured Thiodictyon sp.]
MKPVEPTGLQLIRLLADGDCHSGAALARGLRMTRAGVWKALHKAVEDYGLALESIPGQGYRLNAPLELLDPALILGYLSAAGASRLARLQVNDLIDSTNERLMAAAIARAPAGTVCLAERQSAGRGRRGRVWVSPFGANLYLSVLWRYPVGPAGLGGISLAAGVAVATVLQRLGLTDIALKWPNDLLWRRRKLGGLLLEVAGETQGPSHLVVGLGLNLRLDPDQAQGIDQPWVDLREALGQAAPGRNRLAAALIDALLETLERFGQVGLAPFLDEWTRFDLLRDQQVQLQLGERLIVGDYAGIDPDGALRLNTADGLLRAHSGEVSLRLAPPPEAPRSADE